MQEGCYKFKGRLSYQNKTINQNKKSVKYQQLLIYQKNITQLTVKFTSETLMICCQEKSHTHSGRLDLKSFLMKQNKTKIVENNKAISQCLLQCRMEIFHRHFCQNRKLKRVRLYYQPVYLVIFIQKLRTRNNWNGFQ